MYCLIYFVYGILLRQPEQTNMLYVSGNYNTHTHTHTHTHTRMYTHTHSVVFTSLPSIVYLRSIIEEDGDEEEDIKEDDGLTSGASVSPPKLLTHSLPHSHSPNLHSHGFHESRVLRDELQ